MWEMTWFQESERLEVADGQSGGGHGIRSPNDAAHKTIA